jgi:hypothetical protein
MELRIHEVNDIKIAELVSDDLLIQTTQDALDLMVDVYYQDMDRMILHEKNITPDFFDLQNGIAGDILQKYSNYRMRLAIVGTFKDYTKKSFTDFIFESNKLGQINFVGSVEVALGRLAKG